MTLSFFIAGRRSGGQKTLLAPADSAVLATLSICVLHRTLGGTS